MSPSIDTKDMDNSVNTKAMDDQPISEIKHIEHMTLSTDVTAKVTPLMGFFAFCIALSGWMLNFDISYSGTVLQMESFNRAFGHCNQSIPAATAARSPGQTSPVEICRLDATAQSIGSSIYILFFGLGAGLSGFSSHYLGRRGGLQLGCLIIAVGAAGMLGTSHNFLQYVMCKCIGAIGLGHMQVLSPIYAAECTPARRRGFLVTFFSVGGGLGAVIVSLVCLGSSKLTNNWAWKTPIVCQIPIAVLFGCVLMIFPESPRWLMSKGKVDSATKSFAKFYHKDPNSPEIIAQVDEVRLAIEFECTIASTTSWLEIFRKTAIRRAFIAAFVPIAASLSGGFAMASFAALFLADLGIKNPFAINVVLNSSVMAGTWLGPFIIEFLGRRWTYSPDY